MVPYFQIALVLSLLALIEVGWPRPYGLALPAAMEGAGPLEKVIHRRERPKMIALLAILIVVGLILFAGLRYETGYDYFSYENVYLKTSDLKIEPLYHLSNLIFNWMNSPFWLFLLSYSFFIIYVKWRFINKYSPYVILSLLVYFANAYIVFDFGVLRQAASTAFVAFAWVAANHRQFKKFIILICFACGFHISAIIFLPYYWMANINMSLKNAALAIAFTLFGAWIFSHIPAEKALLALIPLAFAAEKVSTYTGSISNATPPMITLGAGFKIIFVLYYIYKIKKSTQDYESGNGAFIPYFIGVLGFILFGQIPIIASRLFSYFKFFEVLFYADLIKIHKIKIQRIGLAFAIIVSIMLQLSRDLSYEYSDVLFPYRSLPTVEELLHCIF